METIEIVSIEDPALDATRMQMRRYAETRDPALIIERMGMRAARFRIRDLTANESDLCDERATIVQKMNWALGFALISVTVGGETLDAPSTMPDPESGGTKRVWTGAELGELRKRFGKTVLREIAMVIVQRDERAGEAFGGGVPSFTLPPLSQDALDRIVRLNAAANPPALTIAS